MRWLCLLLISISSLYAGPVTVGIDVLLRQPAHPLLTGKKLGVVTNHTALSSKGRLTLDLLQERAKAGDFTIKAFFAPEHGLRGLVYAGESVSNSSENGIPVYSLHGETRRPTAAMLKGIDVLVYDIQDIGSRSYTYLTTLCYCMEECAKKKIPVVVLDRPNPMGGLIVDGPMLDQQWRSFVGYLDIPYCHGMTTGELAVFFNQHYKIGCSLTVIPMEGWRRSMLFADTGLTWVPTSPHIPEATSPLFYPATGILGELQMVNIGVGYTLPFKVVGAPWIDAEKFAAALNSQNPPGARFHPFHYQPFFGRFAKEDCHGVLLEITQTAAYRPVAIQYIIIGTLKSLYPTQFQASLKNLGERKEMFCKVNGTEAVFATMVGEKFITWKLREIHADRRREFAQVRPRYLKYPE